jgi:cyclohexanone monooxygenase
VARNGIIRNCRPRRATTAITIAAPDMRPAGGRRRGFMAVYNNVLLDKAANDTAADFVRSKIAEIIRIPPRPNCCSRTTTRSAQAYLRRFGLLCGLQPAERRTRRHQEQSDRRDHQTRRVAGKVIGRTRWCWRPFDAMTGSVAKIDIVGAKAVR